MILKWISITRERNNSVFDDRHPEPLICNFYFCNPLSASSAFTLP